MPRVEIEKATTLGFCFGVRRALEITERAVQRGGPLYSLGALVHNRQVVARLQALGVIPVAHLEEAEGKGVIIPSHGVGPQVLERLQQEGFQVTDATCPIVAKAQRQAREMAEDGLLTIIFGDSQHPEVKGILAWGGDRVLAATDLSALPRKLPRRLGLLSQTTQSPARFAAFTSELLASHLERLSELRLYNTICQPTQERQAAALELARKVDLMLVIGGKDSANTRRLAELCSPQVTTYHVEGEEELSPSWLAGCRRIGVTAGASTPDEVIGLVIHRLEILTGSLPVRAGA